MDRIDLDMGDVFGDQDETAEQQMMTDHPEMDDDDRPMAEGETAENDDEAVLANIKNLVKGAAKQRVSKPQPKLDAQRLKSNRGLPGLLKTFEKVKFKGRGHEVSDLRLMMNHMEHWGHRLFPKMTFDEFISRLEKLGNKREMRTCLSRIRLDMPVCDDDFNPDDLDDPSRGDGSQNEADDPEAAFDEMVRQQQEKETTKRNDEDDEFDYFDGAPAASSPPPAPVTPGLSDEQKDRAERNKMAALAKRAARLGLPSQLSQNSPSSQPETTILISSEINEENKITENEEREEIACEMQEEPTPDESATQ
ncbi:hypothetical protein CAPTEDRAFT_225347 [Capitella teleta]|uniref:TIMELESS-interacting protein n=1 Tax=Capitella teleta TaxID=283909 RepID=R7UD62_CAPTE|nr:hypothetical protein CAPTEDRAFT_225346 [Capitella teleta]ELU01207.1 hypothetical protein CAPTEDRAFT_225347 [Capitella teleta]|eukprot:ELU01205.1 hypothetical protein CAPTEDRAFT_225346 [Capitella teleta]